MAKDTMESRVQRVEQDLYGSNSKGLVVEFNKFTEAFWEWVNNGRTESCHYLKGQKLDTRKVLHLVGDLVRLVALGVLLLKVFGML